MRGEDDLRLLSRLRDLLVPLSGLLLIHGLFLVYGPYFLPDGLRETLSMLFQSLSRVWLFSRSWMVKLDVVVLLLLYVLGLKPLPGKTAIAPSLLLVLAFLTLPLLLLSGSLSLLLAPEGSAIVLWDCVIQSCLLLLLLGLMVLLSRSRLALTPPGDVYNRINESFLQQERCLATPFSVNLRMSYGYHGTWRKGWINIVNPFRGTMVLGTPGSGKTFSVVESFIVQLIRKDFSMMVYDYKYPTLTLRAYQEYLALEDRHVGFHTVCFSDPSASSRCNPLDPKLLTDISDAWQAAYSIMLNLNRTWINRQGEFFVESPITLLTAVIWFLRGYEGGRCCTLPHAIELMCQPYEDLIEVLMAQDDLQGYLSAFMDAWKGGAQDQLQGQLASAKIPLSRLISPPLYYIMSGNDFSLDINSQDHPLILAIGSDALRQDIYAAPLGLMTSVLIRQINRPGKKPCALVLDELPTMYVKGLDQLIATARSNHVAILLGVQDLTQLIRDYGQKEADTIFSLVGNWLSGQVSGRTADLFSKRMGRILQERQSRTLSSGDVNQTTSYQMDTMVTPSRIALLEQGEFIGQSAAEYGIDDGGMDMRNYCCRIHPMLDEVRQDMLPKTLQGDVDEELKKCFDRIRREAREIIQKEVALLRGSGRGRHRMGC